MSSRATLLFVHGTGVRGDKFANTLRTLRSRVSDLKWDVVVEGCYWGDHGARLHCEGRSIPEYIETDGNPDCGDRRLDVWAVLYVDPWYELRLLREMPKTATRMGELPPAQRLIDDVNGFRPSVALSEMLGEHDLVEPFDAALVQLRRAPELRGAAATAAPEPLEHRGAIARGLLASALRARFDNEEPAIGGVARDRLETALTDELGGYGLGPGQFLREMQKRLLSQGVTAWMTGRRGKLTDAAAPLAGDVLLYLARGQVIRTFLRDRIETIDGPVVLLGHSLGGIMCVDTLVGEQMPGVQSLVTVGSQAPFLYEIGALPSLCPDQPLPPHFPPWVNIYDRRDALSYKGSGVFGDRVTDIPVDNGEPFVASHSGYWANETFWSALEPALSVR